MPEEIVASSQFDRESQKRFLNGLHLRSNHLDWVKDSDRLHQKYAYTLVKEGEIQAMMSCAAESQSAAWIRYFVCQRDGKHATYFSTLVNHALGDLKNDQLSALYALGTPEWFEKLLLEHHFAPKTEIISLQLQTDHPPIQLEPSEHTIRQMTARDLPPVQQLDRLAFADMWQLSEQNLKNCYQSGTYNTVCIKDNKIVAYLISEFTFMSHHLSRIAVHPDFQGQGLSKAMIKDFIQNGLNQGDESFTVNTPADNLKSLSLYKSLGFIESFPPLPVYTLSIL